MRGVEEIMAAIVDLFPSPDFDDVAARVSKLSAYAYTGDLADLEALDPADRAAVQARS